MFLDLKRGILLILLHACTPPQDPGQQHLTEPLNPDFRWYLVANCNRNALLCAAGMHGGHFGITEGLFVDIMLLRVSIDLRAELKTLPTLPLQGYLAHKKLPPP